MTLSYWLDPPEPIAQPLDASRTADVVVIGGGLCGSAATLALAEAGVDVVLVEADQIAGAATGRNAGFILQGTAERYDRARSHLGEDRARRIHAWSLDNHDRIAAAVETYGIDCEYRRSGSLQLAGSEAEEAELVRSAKLLVEDGFEAELLEAELPAVYRDAGFRLGVFLPRDGELHPARFVRGVVQAAMAKGATVHERSRVLELDARGAGDVTVKTERGTLSASAAIVATNAYTGQLIPWFAETVDPVRGQMLATHPVGVRVFDVPVYADHGYDYWRQDAQGRIVLGGWRNLDPESERGYDDQLNADIQAKMTAFLRRFAPLADVQVSHQWSGVMGFSQDGLPLVGPAPGLAGVLAGAGFTGHGFGFAFLAGQALAQVALEGDHPFVSELDARRLR